MSEVGGAEAVGGTRANTKGLLMQFVNTTFNIVV